MRSFAIVALLAGAAVANPVPQDFDWEAIEAADPVPTAVEIPIVNAAAAATTVSYAPAAAAASVAAAIMDDPTETNLRRDVDTAEAWAANSAWADAANSAATPSGYALNYQAKTGSSERVYGYLGYSTLQSYDVQKCANKCTATAGCASFNIYYERDPSVDPTEANPDPASTTVIKCTMWSGATSSTSATNQGQWRLRFHVVIGGSNAYTSLSVATPAGYSAGVPLGKATINAPLDCAGHDTYMTVKMWTDGIFDVGRCAAACSSQSAYNRAYPRSDGTYSTCQFIATYVLYNNTIAVGQQCSLYTESWPTSFATNSGQFRGKDKFTISNSWTFSNSTGNADKPVGCTNPTKPA